MENHRRDDSPSGLSDIVEGDGLLGTGITVSILLFLHTLIFSGPSTENQADRESGQL